MNRKQFQKLGVPPDCTKAAIQALCRKAAEQGTGMGLKGKRARQLVAAVLDESARSTRPTRSGASSPASCWPSKRRWPASRSPTARGATTSTPAPTSRCGCLPGAERRRRGADAGRPRRLRPADRRRAGLRERRDSVRGGRRHRLPHEALGARPAGRVARRPISTATRKRCWAARGSASASSIGRRSRTR